MLPKLINEGWIGISPRKTIQIGNPITANIEELSTKGRDGIIRKAAKYVKKGGKPYIIDLSTNNACQYDRYLLVYLNVYGFIEANENMVTVTYFKVGDVVLTPKSKQKASEKYPEIAAIARRALMEAVRKEIAGNSPQKQTVSQEDKRKRKLLSNLIPNRKYSFQTSNSRRGLPITVEAFRQSPQYHEELISIDTNIGADAKRVGSKYEGWAEAF